MSEAVLILTKDLRVTYVNDAFCRQVGKTVEELIGQPIAILGPPPFPDMPTDSEELEAWIRERGPIRGEMPMRTGKGTSFPAFMTIAPVMDDRGDILAYVHTHHDLREVKQAEIEAHESVELFKAISTVAQDAVLLLDDSGRISFWNDAASRLFGYSAEEALGREAYEFLALASDAEAARDAWPRLVESGSGPIIENVREIEALRRDGSKVPLELSFASLQLNGSWHALCIARDITERKQKEHKLRLFHDLLAHSMDAVEVIDHRTLRFIDMNEKGCRDLGYTREEILSMSVPDIDSSHKHIRRLLTDRKAGQHDATVIESVHRRKDGSEFPVEVSFKFVEIEGETYVLSIARDITQRKQSEERLRRSNRALRTLSSCNMALVHAAREQDLLDEMCRTVVEDGGYHLAWIGITRDDNRTVQRVASASRHPGRVKSSAVQKANTECGLSPATRAVNTGSMQLAKSLREQTENPACQHCAEKFGYSSCLALPLKDDDEVFGVLNICAVEEEAFDDGEIALLQELSEDLSFGILSLRTREQRNHYQHESLKNLNRYKEALLGTIRSVAYMAEKRDPYTAGHQARVADLACAIAEELGLDERRIEGLRLGSMIHDIGKISVPAEILNKPGKLSPPEFEIIKSHVWTGHDIIKDIDFPWPVADMILQHHERLDGSGYPQGLKGEAICMEARILAVADEVDAISGHRPYRPSLGLENALNTIEAERGKSLDAAAVDACLKLFRQKGYALGVD